MKIRFLCAPLLCAAIFFNISGCTAQTAQPTPSSSASPWADIPAAVVEFALNHMEDTAAAYAEGERGFAVTATELTGLNLVTGCDLFPDASVEVYRMEYRLKPEDPKKVVMAGGMTMDDEGWLLQTQSMGSPCLVVENKSGTYMLLGETWTGEVDIDGGWEGRLGSLLVGWGTEQGDDNMIEAGRLAMARCWLSRAEDAIAPLLGTAPTEGQPYTDSDEAVWLKLTGYKKYEDQRMDDQVLGSLYTVFAKDLVDSLFERYVYVPDPVLLEREGGLYVRQDAAGMLGWDYTIDLSTLALDEDYTGTDRLDFTAQGTGHGGKLTWYFSMVRENGTWLMYRYYTLAAEYWNVPAEFGILADETWFGLESRAVPDALGEPGSVKKDPNNAYSGTGFWRTEYYDGVTVTRYDDGSDEIYGAVTLEVTRSGLSTWRGVEVGDSMETVSAAYPEAVASVYNSAEGITINSLRYEASPGPGFYMEFFFDESGTLKFIAIKNEFD